MQISFPLKSRLNLFGHPANGMLPAVWFGQLFRFGFHISMLPKVICISVIVLLNYPLALLERLMTGRKVRSTSIEKPVFIIGHARSGTTFLHYLMAQDERFVTPKTYETIIPSTYKIMGGFFRWMLSKLMPKSRPMDNLKMGPDEPKEEEFALSNLTMASFAHAFYFPNKMRGIFDETVAYHTKGERSKKWKSTLHYFARKLMMDNPEHTLLLKSPYNTARIRHILDLYPDARFVHVKRSPEDVIASMEKLMSGILPILSFHKPNTKLVSDWIEWSYQMVYEEFFNSVELIPSDQLVELDYSELVKDPLYTLEKIYSAVGLSHFSKSNFEGLVKEHADYKTNKHENFRSLKPEMRAIKERLGYD